MRGGYYEMIHTLMDQHSRKLLPWLATSPVATSTPFLTAGGNPIQPPHSSVPLICVETDVDFEYADCQESDQEILFEYEGWVIEHYTNSPPGDCDWISHYCPSYGWRYRTDQWTLLADGICAGCCQTVPEEILGVWKLKNFDHLVGTEEAREIQTPMLYDHKGNIEADELPVWA